MTNDPSVEFLEHHVVTTFKQIMESRRLLDVDWVYETHDSSRAYGIMSEKNEQEKESNLIVLFPPFFE